MAHYAYFDENNIVQEVHVGIDENDLSGLPEGVSSWEEHYTNINPQGWTCKRTSYNTIGNIHLEGGTPFRGNYAGIGYIYDESNDVFYAPKPFDSWTLDTDDWNWKPPTPHPNTLDSSDTHPYTWDEDTQEWVE